MEQGLTTNQLIQELTKSPHGDLKAYEPIGRRAAKEQVEFLAHLIAWNARKGQIRDAKVALPVVALTAKAIDPEFKENALAHLASLDPRNLLRGLRFAKEIGVFQNGHGMKSMVRQYLRAREANWGWWQRTAVQHRSALKELYMLFDVHPAPLPREILMFNRAPAGSVFEKIRNLSAMPSLEAAGVIITEKIPFLVAMGALGKKAKEEALVMALVDRMSASELVNNSKMLERIGLKNSAVLRSAYAEALKKAEKSGKNTLKSAKAIDAVSDAGLKAQLTAMQEKQIAKVSVDGNWLVLGDKSPSMAESIEVSRLVSATLAKMVSGDVHLVFFDNTARYIKASGMTYEQILGKTRGVTAGGNGTSIGAGLQYALVNNLDVDGIAIISDGGDNQPPSFANCYKQYVQRQGKDIPIYLYRCDTSPQWRRETETWLNAFIRSLADIGQDVTQFDIRGGVDAYSLPNLVQTMRTNRYSLAQEILDTPLLTREKVYGHRKNEVAIESEEVYA
mgnify:CR=1 FL=1